MKRKIIGSIVILGLGAVALFYIHQGEVETGPAAQISKVRFQARAAFTNAIVNKRLQFPFYVSEIKTIDASKCPPDFRVAWVDFTFACEESMRLKPDAGGLEAFESLAALLIGNIQVSAERYEKSLSKASSARQKIFDAQTRIREAVHECNRVEAKYGAK